MAVIDEYVYVGRLERDIMQELTVKRLYIVYLFIGRFFLAYIAIVSSGPASLGLVQSYKYSSASESRVSGFRQLSAFTT
jgi:hypothetical protein